MSERKDDSPTYWLVPVQAGDLGTVNNVIETLLGQDRIFGFSEKGSIHRSLQVGDWLCFYGSKKGIVAHARVERVPERQRQPHLDHAIHPWVVELQDIKLYLSDPVTIDDHLRRRLDVFSHRKPDVRWSWFVQQTHKISSHDFKVLTRQETP